MRYSSAFIRENGGRWYGVLSYKDGSRWRTTSHRLDAKGKADARRELASWRAEMEAEAERAAQEDERATSTIPDYLTTFIDTLETGGVVEGSTVADYRATARRIAEAFDGMAVRDLTPEAVRAWEADMLGRGLSPTTVGKSHRLLKQAMKDAVGLGIIGRNPLDAVKPPKRKTPRPNALDLAGRTKVLDGLDSLGDTPTTMAARIALYTGMREGEICALRWSDVDLAGGTLTVGRSIGMRKGGTYVKETKTGRVRDVPIPGDLAHALARWRSARTAEALAAGVAFPGRLYVTGRVDGTYQGKDSLSHEWHTLAQGFSVVGTEGRTPTFHDLRHTFATLAIAGGDGVGGVDVRTVSSILGHATPSMTLNVYAAADPDAKARAGKAINDAMRRRPAKVARLDRTGTTGE